MLPDRGQVHRVRRVVPLFLLLGCTDPATQLVVSVGTDYAVPDELSWVEVHTERVMGGASSPIHTYDLEQIAMPFSFGIAPKKGEEDLEIYVVVDGFERQGSRVLVRTRVRTGFIKHRTLNLPIFLSKECREADCDDGETCEYGDCVDEYRDPKDLNPYDPNLDPNVPNPPQKDAGTPIEDGGVDLEDGGVELEDGGVELEDGGTPPDVGPPDDCAVTVPRMLGSIDIPFDPNLDLLAANLDGDMVTEFVAARREPSNSPIAVLDFDACDAPVVTSSAAYGELRQGLLQSNGLYAVERRKISRWQYSGPNMLSQSVGAVAVANEIERLAFSRQGGSAMAVVNLDGSGWSYAAFDPATGFGASTPAPNRPLGFSAELSGRFYHGDDLGLRSITLGSAAVEVAAAPRVVDPVVSANADDIRLIASRANDQELLIAYYDRGSFNGTQRVSFGARIVAGPITASEDDSIRVYVLLENGLLTGCRANEGPPCTITNNTKQIPADEIDAERGLLLAYVDSDPTPDVVLVTRRGKIYFQRGNALANDAAPMIDLGEDARGGAAIAHDFFTAFQRQGHLLVVPHDRKLSLVGWLGRSGSTADLWLQHRRDARRSGAAP